MLDGFKFNPGLLRVCRLVAILLITCHWVGCMWWFVGVTSDLYGCPHLTNTSDTCA